MKPVLLAGALACALSAAACTPGDITASDLSALAAAAGSTSPTLPPSAVVSDVLAAAGVSAAGQATVNKNIAAVQQAAITLCGIKPLASGVLNLGIALSPSIATVANSTIGQKVRGAAVITCNALAAAPTYTGMGRGQMVRAIVPVNGRDVSLYGIRVR